MQIQKILSSLKAKYIEFRYTQWQLSPDPQSCQ